MLKQIVLSLAAVAFVAAHHSPDHVGHELRAITRLSDSRGIVQGNITFTQMADGKVHVEGTILGLTHGRYGFHVHEKGDVTGGCASTGGHFNPDKKQHGHPDDLERHVGDLGNIEFDENRIGRVDIVDSMLSLVGPHNIIGRAVVLHAGEDDYGRGGHIDSKKTGNSGGRVACGVIGILDPIYGWETSDAAAASLATAVLLPIISVLLLLH